MTAMCRRWRPVNPARYGTSRLVCHLERGHIGGGVRGVLDPSPHITRDGWMWLNPTHDRRPAAPYRIWRCTGDLGQCGAKRLSSFDEARAAGWRIGWRKVESAWILDPHCPRCARPDPELVKLCRELDRSVRR